MPLESQPLDALPIWAFGAATLAIALLSIEIGHRIGRRRREREQGGGVVSTLVASGLAFLAFLLAFIFNISAARLEERRALVQKEANAVGTYWLRADFLPAESKRKVRGLLREYLAMRIEAATRGRLGEALLRSEEIHGLLWAETVGAAREVSPTPVAALLVAALNDVIDVHSERVNSGMRLRIPPPVWAVFFAVSILAFSALGYQQGISSPSRSPAVFLIVLAFCLVILLVTDLDRPHQGLLRVKQDPLGDALRSMGTE